MRRFVMTYPGHIQHCYVLCTSDARCEDIKLLLLAHLLYEA